MPRPRRHLFAPEVVQTSAMDCGPAVLTCLLEGHGLSVSYGRLREACQTDVDGTSIDMLETIAVQLGLHAEQILVPVDHLFLPETMALPSIVVVRLPSGVTHFVVAWRRHGRVVQVMDPSTGRRWPTCRRFLDELYVHTQALPATAWRAWAETDEFLGGLRRRWATLAIDGAEVERLLAEALAHPAWVPLAALDATTRMLTALVHGRGLRRGQQATRALATFFARASQEDPTQPSTVPAAYWMVRPAPPGPDGTPSLLVRGAVLVRVCGWQASSSAPVVEDTVLHQEDSTPLAPDLVAALEAPPSRPGRHLLRLLRADGLLTPTTLGLGVGLAAGSVLIEALLWRGLVDLPRHLGAVEQRLGALGALLVFVSALLLLDLMNALGLWRLGRRLEARLRLAFLAKIPRLGDRYFQSRPTSDMAERSHSVHRLRLLPGLGGQGRPRGGRTGVHDRRPGVARPLPGTPGGARRGGDASAAAGHAASAHGAGFARPHPCGGAGPFLARCAPGAHGRPHPRGRTGHAPRVRESARRVDTRRAAPATRCRQHRRRAGAPGLWPRRRAPDGLSGPGR